MELLPKEFDLTPKGKIVKRATWGEKGYIENTEYNLIIRIENDCLALEYYGEDDTRMAISEYFNIINKNK